MVTTKIKFGTIHRNDKKFQAELVMKTDIKSKRVFYSIQIYTLEYDETLIKALDKRKYFHYKGLRKAINYISLNQLMVEVEFLEELGLVMTTKQLAKLVSLII